MTTVVPGELAKTGISSELYDQEYYLSEAGGKESLEQAIRSGDFSNIFHSHIYQAALEISNPKPTDHILDIGCGRGELSFMLAKQGIPVAGIDYSSDSIALCNELRSCLPDTHKKLVSFRKMNILDDDLDLEDEAFDVIFFTDVIEHLTASEGKKALTNMHRLLRPGGRVVIHTNNLYFEKLAYRAVAFYYHGLKVFSAFGTKSIEESQSPYEHLHINYCSKQSLAGALRDIGFKAQVSYVRPTGLDQVRALIPPGDSLIRRPVPYLVYWLSKTPAIALLSPSLWGVGTKR